MGGGQRRVPRVDQRADTAAAWPPGPAHQPRRGGGHAGCEFTCSSQLANAASNLCRHLMQRILLFTLG